jgi:hypothetical protein
MSLFSKGKKLRFLLNLASSVAWKKSTSLNAKFKDDFIGNVIHCPKETALTSARLI